MRRHAPPTTALAFTLVELIATITILGLSVAASMPILSSVRDAAHAARTISVERHEATIAIQRIAEILRPSGNPGDTDSILSRMQPDELRIASGLGVELDNGSLIERAPNGRTHTLARSIVRFEIRYLLDDGVTAALTPADVHAVEIRLDTTTSACATRIFLRGRMARP